MRVALLPASQAQPGGGVVLFFLQREGSSSLPSVASNLIPREKLQNQNHFFSLSEFFFAWL